MHQGRPAGRGHQGASGSINHARSSAVGNEDTPPRRQEFDAPLPADVHDLDLVINFLFYHDTYWMKVDNAAMNRAVFAALRPGGAYVIVDHSAAPGTGTSASQTLHRVEESVVRAEVEAAGFRLATSADFLRNPAAATKAGRRGQADRFILKFVKP